jgi:hypothetical protein
MDNLIVSFIFNVLLGVVMFFMKQSNDTMKERLQKVETDVERIKDGTVKKEDFREFKEELWVRFDKMEMTIDKKLAGIK